MRRLALLFAAVLAAVPAFAQWEGGLAVGPSTFTITGSDRTDFSPRLAFGARLWLERELRSGLAIGSGVAYLSKGARGASTVGEIFPNEPTGDPNREIRLRLAYPYVEVPLYVAFSPQTRGRLQPQVYAGGHLSFAQAAYASYAIAGGGYTDAERDESVQSRDAGISGGVLMRSETDRFGTLVAGVHVSVGLENLRRITPPLHAVGALLFVGVAF